MEPVRIDGLCSFPGPKAPSCPGFAPADPERWPDHLRYLPFINSAASEGGCAHLVAMRSSRGGFRPGCGHPGGNPACWNEKSLVGRPQTPVAKPLKAFAP